MLKHTYPHVFKHNIIIINNEWMCGCFSHFCLELKAIAVILRGAETTSKELEIFFF